MSGPHSLFSTINGGEQILTSAERDERQEETGESHREPCWFCTGLVGALPSCSPSEQQEIEGKKQRICKNDAHHVTKR